MWTTRGDAGRAARRALLASVVPLALCFAGCAAPDEPGRPNLLVVVVDTLRADHLGYAGYARDTSPRLDRFAAGAVTFDDHYAHASRTGPSIASLFTGLHPRSHGVINPLTSFDAKGTLADERTTLAELLAAEGYACHGAVANINVSPRFGFGQGFETYEYVDSQQAAEINGMALERLAEAASGGTPFFLYLHYMEPHSPYAAPTHRERWIDPAYAGPLDGRHEQLDAIVAGAYRPTDPDVARLEALYDQEIRFFDDQLDILLGALRDHGLEGETIVVFTSDHGEEFLDHGSVLHGYTLYEEQLRVPLVVRDGRREDARRVSGPTRHVDLLPTLLELLDVETTLPLQGRSLVPELRGDATPAASTPVVGQASLRAVKWVRGRSLLADGWKLIVSELPAADEELYHVAVDPHEQDDLIDERPDVADTLRRRLDELLASMPEAAAGRVELTDEEKRRLRSLGYVN